MAEYLIQDTTLEAIGDSIRANLTTLEPTASTARIASTYDAGSGQLTDDVQVFYREFIDIQNDYINELQEPTTDIFVSYDYKPNNDGVITLAIYKTDPNIPSPDLRDQFFYQGRATVNGVVYDKWRKISDNSLPDSQDYGAYDTLYTWESIGKQYWYTNIITEATISPLDMPAKIEEIAAQGGSVAIVDSLTVTPSTSRQVFDALDEGAAGYAAVIVDAMPTTSPDISGIDYYGINHTSGDYVVLQMGYTQPTAGYMEAGATTYDYPITTDIPVRDDSDISVSGNTATIPEGYYNNTSITLPETGGASVETCTVTVKCEYMVGYHSDFLVAYTAYEENEFVCKECVIDGSYRNVSPHLYFDCSNVVCGSAIQISGREYVVDYYSPPITGTAELYCNNTGGVVIRAPLVQNETCTITLIEA